mmetsp:Transcript_40501/g.105059  ORF Transcript_40501/g.105059 Transcript_40501/m.105059 type:complete len:98 (-) Transcript_40501:4729-5022(-)
MFGKSEPQLFGKKKVARNRMRGRESVFFLFSVKARKFIGLRFSHFSISKRVTGTVGGGAVDGGLGTRDGDGVLSPLLFKNRQEKKKLEHPGRQASVR